MINQCLWKAQLLCEETETTHSRHVGKLFPHRTSLSSHFPTPPDLRHLRNNPELLPITGITDDFYHSHRTVSGGETNVSISPASSIILNVESKLPRNYNGFNWVKKKNKRNCRKKNLYWCGKTRFEIKMGSEDIHFQTCPQTFTSRRVSRNLSCLLVSMCSWFPMSFSESSLVLGVLVWSPGASSISISTS